IITNTATATTATTDPNLANNAATRIVTVGTVSAGSAPSSVQPQSIGIFDPAISKVAVLQPGGFGFKGEKITWTITIVNNGSAAGNNVIVTDAIQPELHVDGADTGKGTFNINGQTVTFTIGTLNPGETVTMHIYTTVIKATSTIANTACL